MEETAIKLLQNKIPLLLEKFSDEILDASDFRGDLMIHLQSGKIREIFSFLKNHPVMSFPILIDLFGMDYLLAKPSPKQRFAVLYQLYSFSHKRRLHFKVFLDNQNPQIHSIHDIFQSANWCEREAWDLFGITFLGHPNLTRILCHNSFEGHALRKDYPSDQYQRLKTPIPSTRM